MAESGCWVEERTMTLSLDHDTTRVAESVSTDRLMEDTREIARWVRLSGSPEERRAFAYIERRLRDAGLRTQLLEHDALISLPVSAALRMIEPDADEIPCITHRFAVSTPPGGITAETIHVGESAPTAEMVRGRLAIADGLATPGRVAQLQSAGAVGVVFLNRDPLVHEMIVSTIWGSPTPLQMGQLPSVPVVSTAGEAAARVRARLAGRRPGRAQITAVVQTEWRRLPLLTADLDGTSDDTFVLLAGHVDSWHYGAMDNGGANAVMMEVGRLLAQTQLSRGFRLAFWSGHSHGRYAGSTWYVDSHWEELDARCAAHLYIDSVGGRGATKLDAGYCMPETREVGVQVIGALTGQQYRGTRVGRSGDQSFLGIGIPSLFMSLSEHPADGPQASRDFAATGIAAGGGLGWWWHTPEDTVDKLDPAALTRDARVYAAAVHILCAAPVLPLDYGATAAEIVTSLRALQQRLGDRFDVSDCLREAERLLAAAGQFTKDAKSQSGDMKNASVVNRTLMQLGRILIPVLYTRVGRFDHDAAMAIPALPPLLEAGQLADVDPESDEAKALRVAAVRGRNRLVQALREARQLIERTGT
ncbi:MAG: Zn-dependent exopeptidase M28 [Bacillati bacterium ANGP1]|uniref:Zn-dependent exopeptidase M28 n=1 Tax=Candidatus Segetimicrobium genomatis TaxID=2569760 RepID=A0A537KTI0_9BACT|nr:MAG: Zn-dependent exopeptidase M28 [Terrabacteria group bacterium ANGP1]